MFARITVVRWTTPPDQRLMDEWAAAVQLQPGFHGYLTVDSGEGQSQIIILWDSREAGDQWTTSPDHLRVGERIGKHIAGYDVTDATVSGALLKDIVA